MNEHVAHLLAQDGVDACNADGSPDPIGMASLVLGGVCFLGLFGVWIVTNWITGEFT